MKVNKKLKFRNAQDSIICMNMIAAELKVDLTAVRMAVHNDLKFILCAKTSSDLLTDILYARMKEKRKNLL